MRAGGVVAAPVGEDGDGAAAAGAQAGEVGAGSARVELGADPPAAPVDLQRGGARGVAGETHCHLLAQELDECGAKAHLQGALPGAGAHGLVGDAPRGGLRVEVGEHGIGAHGVHSQELADGVEGGGPGDLAGDGVGLEAVGAHVLLPGAARAVLEASAGAHQEAPELGGVVVIGEVAGASGHGVVQEEGGTGLAGGAARHGVGDADDAQVGGGPSGDDLQPHEDRGGQGVHPHPVGGESQGEDEGEGLGAQLAHEVHGDGVLDGVAAVPAPGTVLASVGNPGARVELAAGLAQAEVPGGDGGARDPVDALTGQGSAGVEPAQIHGAIAGQPEPGVLHAPLAHRARGVEVGHRQDLEMGADPVVAGVPDSGVVPGDVGEDPGQAQDPPGAPDVGDGGVAAPRALRRRRGHPHLGAPDVGVSAGPAAEPPLRLLAQVGGVDALDAHLQAAGVEGGAGGELAQGVNGGPLDVVGLGAELAAVWVLPGHSGGQAHRVVDERVVGQDPVALQGRDPVLPVQLEDPRLGCLPGALGGALGSLVLLGGVGALGGGCELGQGLADLALLVAQPLGFDAVLGAGPHEHLAGPGAAVLGHPGAQAVERGRAFREGGGEGLGEQGAVALDPPAHGGDEGPVPGGPQGGPGGTASVSPGGDGRVVFPGEGVDDGGEELAAKDFLGPQVGRRRRDGAIEEPRGVVEDGEPAAPAGHVGQGERRAAAAARAADPLHVGGDRRRQGAEHDGGQVPDVDTHLQGGGGHEDIGVARHLLGALEPGLDSGALVGVEQRGVLVGVDPAHVGAGVHVPVEALRRVRPGLQHAGAAGGQTGGAVQLIDGVDGGRKLGAAGVAHQEQGVTGALAQRGDGDTPGRQAVDGAAAAGAGGGEDAVLGQVGQERAGQSGGVRRDHLQALAGPGGVPGPG